MQEAKVVDSGVPVVSESTEDVSCTIRRICRQIHKETDAILEYTDDIQMLSGDEKENFEMIRQDELEHLQVLVTSLTSIMGCPSNEKGG